MPPVSPCPDAQELERILHGRAPGWDAERLARHLETCGRCADAVDQVLDGEAVVAALRAGRAAAPRAEEDAVRQLVAQVRGLRPDGWGAAPTPPERSAPAVATVSVGLVAAESADEVLRALAPPEEADELGRLGPYGILRLLGSGGMGVVFAARQALPRRVVALKMLLAGPGGGRSLARFHAETEIVARLHHPNVVQVYEVGDHAGRPYFTMEYLDGAAWPSAWPRPRWPPRRRRRWWRRWPAPSTSPTSTASSTAT
jgi:serine/threonine-protein kinase